MSAPFDLNALSGINAASNGLAVISNNLANSQSVGFKSSRAEFSDMFSGTQNSPGNGVRVAAITQDFTQGTINNTGRDLDMALDGEGFFVLSDKSGQYDNIYTRNGSFKLDKDGILTDQGGNPVQGYLLNESLSTDNNTVFMTTLSDIDLDDLNKHPKDTSEMNFNINLDGQEAYNLSSTTAIPTVGSVGTDANLAAIIDPANTAVPYTGTADFSTSKFIYDSLGGEHRITADFFKRGVVDAANSDSDFDADGNTDKYSSWLVRYTVEDYDPETGTYVTSAVDNNTTALATGGNTGVLFELRFDDQGDLQQVFQPNDTDPALITGDAPALDANGEPIFDDLAGWTDVGSTQPTMDWLINNPITGAMDPLSFSVDFADMSGYAGTYNIRGVSQNGYQVGDLIGLSTGADGTIQANYSNGRSVAVAQLAVANFADKNAMEKLGGQTYAESFASGTAQLGTPQSNGLGEIVSGALEYSNVDTAAELVNMIQTQRTYQASAQVISTSQTLTQTILNL
ncbi:MULTISPECIES: flagellar hook protein FlgE [Thiomicrorhabdus]|uniref:Flagellar hook protein FlgE n=1 Tax=Thiomicrorhabdus heinhorstiae TaxID=2748010 RepID=A0ABS0C319_9GAMM|nr:MULTISPECIES: flagellar hook protein FlgE [Thiomicrorhabdus]MBF6058682.1 flagellar hook protein FlgE [Thiomicrorhabdus heinhorstiae]